MSVVTIRNPAISQLTDSTYLKGSELQELAGKGISLAMPKRNFDEFREIDVDNQRLADGTLRAQRKHLERVLEHGKKKLFRALKLGRGFERQKLGRRQKIAQESNAEPEMARLNAEVAALKSLELPVVAELQLYKSMVKSKPILAAPALPSYVSAKVATAPISQNAALYNIQARLFNSNPVKLAMSEIMSSIKAALEIEDTASASKKIRLRAPGNKASTRQVVKIEAMATVKEHPRAKEQKPPASSDLGEDCGKESFDMSAYDSILADSSDNDSAQEGSPQRPSAGIIGLNYEPSKELSPSPPPSESSESYRITRSKKHKNPSSTIKSTVFLPSLTMGGYISGSDSDATNLSTRQNTLPRKNRRGQQERRQIWEKKFGKNANHLKKSQNQVHENRDQGWDARKGARANNEKGKRENGRAGKWSSVDARKRSCRPSRGGPISSGANSDPVQGRKMDDKSQGKGKQADGPLHPSWEAAKKAKEAKKNAKFQGKKVKFD